jgi:hypothetical protein
MCNCGKKHDRTANIPKPIPPPVVVTPQPTPTPEEDWYNNLDTYHITEE